MNIEKDSLVKFLEADNCLGMILTVFEKGGDGPEGILQHVFTDGLEKVKDVPGKLHAMADKWEKENI